MSDSLQRPPRIDERGRDFAVREPAPSVHVRRQLLAVALLKDRRGRVNVRLVVHDLPSGSFPEDRAHRPVYYPRSAPPIPLRPETPILCVQTPAILADCI